jgi:uncharacterized protein YbbK (DUF523 family)
MLNHNPAFVRNYAFNTHFMKCIQRRNCPAGRLTEWLRKLEFWTRQTNCNLDTHEYILLSNLFDRIGMASSLFWPSQIRDRRSGRVVFLAHCLLNENTRYLGGAVRGGAVREIVQQCLDLDIGIVQLPCPEQHAWGGVLKRWLLLVYGWQGTLLFRLRRILVPLALWHTRRIYRKLARNTAAQIDDYQKSGFTVLGVVGVDGSPSCGVGKSLDIEKVVEALGLLDHRTVMAHDVNAIIVNSAIAGRGLYMDFLKGELDRRGIKTEFTAHNLIGELEGKESTVNIGALNSQTGREFGDSSLIT